MIKSVTPLYAATNALTFETMVAVFWLNVRVDVDGEVTPFVVVLPCRSVRVAPGIAEVITFVELERLTPSRLYCASLAGTSWLPAAD